MEKRNEHKSARIARGEQLFLDASNHVMKLPSSQRVQSSQTLLKDILQALRSEDDIPLTEEHIEILTSKLHLISHHFTPEDRKRLTKNALFLFANCSPRNIFNCTKLQLIQSSENPIAKVSAITKNNKGITSNNTHYDDSTPPSVLLTRNARVSITGQNLMPNWGLFNGSIGTVLDVVFKPGESPNTGNQPIYVLVHFELYTGPPFLEDHPKAVPIVAVNVLCNHRCCCNRTFIPLKLAFGKTVHTFQGQNAGPVDEGKPTNPVQRIICDPGTRSFEGINVGLLYTILSRATTLGTPDENENYQNSAIYFIGNNMNRARVENITQQANGNPYVKVVKKTKMG